MHSRRYPATVWWNPPRRPVKDAQNLRARWQSTAVGAGLVQPEWMQIDRASNEPFLRRHARLRQERPQVASPALLVANSVLSRRLRHLRRGDGSRLLSAPTSRDAHQARWFALRPSGASGAFSEVPTLQHKQISHLLAIPAFSL